MWAAALLAPALVVAGAFAAHAATPKSVTAVIAPGFAQGTLLQPERGSTRATADIVNSAATGLASQRWTFIPQRGVRNQYEIQNLKSHLCITTSGTPGRPVTQSRCRDRKNQRWNVKEVNNSFPGFTLVTIRSAWRGPHGQLYLSARRYAQHGGTTMVAARGDGPALDQLFAPGPLPGRGFSTGLGLQLSNGNFGVLDVSGASKRTGAGVIVSAPHSPLHADQLWTFRGKGGRNYKIVNENSGKCLTAPNSAGNQVRQERCVGSLRQLWWTILTPAAAQSEFIYNDYYNNHGYLVLESQNPNTQVGDIVDTWTSSGGSNQLIFPVHRSA